MNESSKERDQTAKPVTCWAGLFSIVWMIGYAMIMDHMGISGFEPYWLFLILIFLTWLGFGLLLAVSGVIRGNVAGRICAALALLVFLYFAWLIISPVFRRLRTHEVRGSANPSLRLE